VSFDSSLAGTSASTWAADPRLHDRPRLDLDGVDELLVVAAHPDDETLGAGGLIADFTSRGIPVHVVVVTDCGQRRTAELEAAMAVLGATWAVLGFEDSATREHRDEIALALEPLISGTSDLALVLAPWRGDGHRDHRVVGEIVAELAKERRFAEYPIWMWHWAHPDSPDVPWDRLVSAPAKESKLVALAEYVSQSEGESPVLRADFLENFERDELFIVGDGSLGAEYFDDIHERHDDPWGFQSRWYEARKRALTLAILPDERYATALEVGCSIGVLSEALVSRVDRLLAVDVSAVAVERARERLGGAAWVEQADVLTEFPGGTFELVVLSEVGYYFGEAGLERVLDGVEAALATNGTLVTCHWRHPVTDYPMSGDAVHEAIRRRGLASIALHTEADFVLEVFSKDARSVGQRTGLA